MTKNYIIEFVRNLFYFFFLRCFSSSCMFASIIQKEKIDVFHSIFLFTWKIMLLTYFPSKRWNATFINCYSKKRRKKKSNQQWKIGPNIFLYFSCQSNKMSSITFTQIGFFHNFLAIFAKKEQNKSMWPQLILLLWR